MVSEARKQSIAWMGDGLLKAYVFSMEGKMAAGAFGRARNYGWEAPLSQGSAPSWIQFQKNKRNQKTCLSFII